MTPSAPIDWREQAQVVASDMLELQERRRREPSPLAPHDFSRVRSGSTDTKKPQFGWSHAATHRVEVGAPGIVLNINDRCVIAVLIFPFVLCRIGTIPSRGDLFSHLNDVSPDAEQPIP